MYWRTVAWLLFVCTGFVVFLLQTADKTRPQYVVATVGVHPHEASSLDDATFAELMDLARHPRVVAIGEMGLDYHYDYAPRDVQQQVFREQLRLARAQRLLADEGLDAMVAAVA